jgi:hypothetical protein
MFANKNPGGVSRHDHAGPSRSGSERALLAVRIRGHSTFPTPRARRPERSHGCGLPARGLSVSHIFGWTRGVMVRRAVKRAPKGRANPAQANGLGQKVKKFTVRFQALKGRDKPRRRFDVHV